MKKKVIDTIYYAFLPLQRQIIFDMSLRLKASDIYLIVDLSNNNVLYNFGSPTNGGVFNNGTLQLVFDTTKMSERDKLMIIVNDEDRTEYLLDKIFKEQKTLNELLIKKLEL